MSPPTDTAVATQRASHRGHRPHHWTPPRAPWMTVHVPRPLRWAVVAITMVGVVALTGLVKVARSGGAAAPVAGATPLPPPPNQPGVRGILRISSFATAPRGARPHAHVTVFVDGPDYAGMEDNDLRGSLDGTFKYAWNQATQSHVRLGRRNSAPRYGEYELFRNVQRWADIALPPHATVIGAVLTLHVEHGLAQPLRVELYRVKKDWTPGTGGTLNNNVSPPKPGEVWWNEARHGQVAWGLPGVSYAASDSAADTDPMPLAEGQLQPGQPTIVFSSRALAHYASDRIAHHAPLLFLVKLTDVQEDVPGTLIEVYSANQGDTHATARRPHLALTWEDTGETVAVEDTIFLEYGRSLELPRLPAHPGRWYDVSFVTDAGFAAPTIEVRDASAGDTARWTRRSKPFRNHGTSLDVKLLAATDPVVLGQPFTSALSDRWIRTAPPDQQIVPWIFISPAGVRDTIVASYDGDDRWSVTFMPDELGRWRYSWTEHFTDVPYHGADGVFDVIPGDGASVLAQLDSFARRLRAADRSDSTQRLRLMLQFAQLERAAMQRQTPATFRSSAGARLRQTLDSIRALWGTPVPNPIPLLPDDPPPWQRARQAHHAEP